MPLSEEGEIKSRIEKGLGSRGRLKILGVLSQNLQKGYTKYAIQTRTGLKSIDVKKDLATLIKIGWVKEHPYTPKKYGINTDDKTALEVTNFLRRIGYIQ